MEVDANHPLTDQLGGNARGVLRRGTSGPLAVRSVRPNAPQTHRLYRDRAHVFEHLVAWGRFRHTEATLGRITPLSEAKCPNVAQRWQTARP
jgi:hypothetical protein